MTDRRGFALIIVLLLMAVGTALMFSAMDGSLAESETARSGTLRRRVLVAAESELWTTLRAVSVPALRLAPLGPVTGTTAVADDITLIAMVEKVDTTVVWIVATATIRRAGVVVARHRVGMSALIPRDASDSTLHLVPERAWAELF
jgi:hypothetical protein